MPLSVPAWLTVCWAFQHMTKWQQNGPYLAYTRWLSVYPDGSHARWIIARITLHMTVNATVSVCAITTQCSQWHNNVYKLKVVDTKRISFMQRRMSAATTFHYTCMSSQTLPITYCQSPTASEFWMIMSTSVQPKCPTGCPDIHVAPGILNFHYM